MTATERAKEWILIVEDDADLRDSLAALLTAEGYPVATAANGQEALQRLRTAPLPGLILLDLMLPAMSGWQLRRRLREDPALAQIPVVVLSGVSLTIDEGLTLDASGYFGKPYDVQALLETVAFHCRSGSGDEPE